MKDILEKARLLSRKSHDQDVADIIKKLGPTPSIATLEEVVKYYKRALKAILTEDLLNWMVDNDQTNFETDDCKVSIKTYVSAKVLDTDKAFPWLISHQYGDLIKDTLDFPKGEFTEELAAILEEKGASYVKKSGIHPQTLKKIMSDRLNDGEDLPDEDMGIKVGYYDECVLKEK